MKVVFVVLVLFTAATDLTANKRGDADIRPEHCVFEHHQLSLE